MRQASARQHDMGFVHLYPKLKNFMLVDIFFANFCRAATFVYLSCATANPRAPSAYVWCDVVVEGKLKLKGLSKERESDTDKTRDSYMLPLVVPSALFSVRGCLSAKESFSVLPNQSGAQIDNLLHGPWTNYH